MLGKEQRKRYIELGKYCEECNEKDESNEKDECSNNIIFDENEIQI